MSNHYLRLLTDVELNDQQQYIWTSLVTKFLGKKNPAREENFVNALTSDGDEYEGSEEYPYTYIVSLQNPIDIKIAEIVVELWEQIYPRDFEIESSAEFSSDCDDCDIEIDDDLHEMIIARASKYLHNRWVEEQVQAGWRYGLSTDNTSKVSPKLRDWDSLNEDYRRPMPMTKVQAVTFLKKYPHLFV